MQVRVTHNHCLHGDGASKNALGFCASLGVLGIISIVPDLARMFLRLDRIATGPLPNHLSTLQDRRAWVKHKSWLTAAYKKKAPPKRSLSSLGSLVYRTAKKSCQEELLASQTFVVKRWFGHSEFAVVLDFFPARKRGTLDRQGA